MQYCIRIRLTSVVLENRLTKHLIWNWNSLLLLRQQYKLNIYNIHVGALLAPVQCHWSFHTSDIILCFMNVVSNCLFFYSLDFHIFIVCKLRCRCSKCQIISFGGNASGMPWSIGTAPASKKLMSWYVDISRKGHW